MWLADYLWGNLLINYFILDILLCFKWRSHLNLLSLQILFWLIKQLFILNILFLSFIFLSLYCLHGACPPLFIVLVEVVELLEVLLNLSQILKFLTKLLIMSRILLHLRVCLKMLKSCRLLLEWWSLSNCLNFRRGLCRIWRMKLIFQLLHT